MRRFQRWMFCEAPLLHFCGSRSSAGGRLEPVLQDGAGQYGAGDRFLGIKVPVTCSIVKACWNTTGSKDLERCIIQHEPFSFHGCNGLQMSVFAVVSDSGTLPEESSFFTSVGHPFTAVCIRTITERPEDLNKGCDVLSGINSIGLLQSVDVAVSLIRDGLPGIPVPDYVDENISTKVVIIIYSYVGVVNKMVWRKF